MINVDGCLTPLSRKPRYLLQPNELKEVFESEFSTRLTAFVANLAAVIHEYTEAKLPDRRPVAFLCAQRKPVAAVASPTVKKS